jgi:uncharacterized protein
VTTPDDASTLEELESHECWELARSRSIGRFAANRTGMGPLVVPINYVVDADLAIVFRSGEGTKLDAVGRGTLTIQIDEIDPLHHVGWSVSIEGTAEWVHAQAADEVGVEPWAPGERPYVVHLNPTRITGRRIRLHQADTDSRGYR